jgi:hypothetical protein
VISASLPARLVVVLALSIGAGAWLVAQEQPVAAPAAKAPGTALQPLSETAREPELALLMGTLQTLTHKLALSADAGNAPLAAFYLHESMEQLRTIQHEAPEYENLPIAVLVERLALPAYSDLEKAVAAPPEPTREILLAGVDRVIQSCNECHGATQHGFLRITRGTEVNPFNQSFQRP